jgi:hypothetical protein
MWKKRIFNHVWENPAIGAGNSIRGLIKMEVFTKREINKMSKEEAQKHLEELLLAYPLIFDQFTMLQEAAWG